MRRKLSFTRLGVATLALSCAAVAVVGADAPGRGLTAPFEREYLRFVIDHHFAALRITELAAGTDLTRDQTIGGMKGPRRRRASARRRQKRRWT